MDLAGRREGRCETGCRLVGMRFNTVGVSDGISMGTDGMSFSLQSRDLIADSIETIMGAQWYDGTGCPARLRQEHARLRDRDGPAQPPGHHDLRRHHQARLRQRTLRAKRKSRSTSSRRSSAYGQSIAGTITDEERQPSCSASPARARARAAACTPPTPWPARSRRWALAALLLVHAGRPTPAKLDECVAAGRAMLEAAGERPQAARHRDARVVSRTPWCSWSPARWIDQRLCCT